MMEGSETSDSNQCSICHLTLPIDGVETTDDYCEQSNLLKSICAPGETGIASIPSEQELMLAEEIRGFILKSVYNANATVIETINAATVDKKGLLRTCSKCDGLVKMALELLKKRKDAGSEIDQIIAILRNKMKSAVWGSFQKRSVPVPSTSQNAAFSVNTTTDKIGKLTAEEWSLLQITKVIKVQDDNSFQDEEESGEASVADNRGPTKTDKKRAKIVSTPMPHSVKKAKLMMADKGSPLTTPKKVEAAGSEQQKPGPLTILPIMKEVFSSLPGKEKNRNRPRGYYADPNYRVRCKPTTSTVSPIRRVSPRLAEVRPTDETAASELSSQLGFKYKNGNSAAFDDIDIYGKQMLDTAVLKQNIPEDTPGKYAYPDGRELGEQEQPTDYSCPACKKNFYNQYFVVYHVSRVHLGIGKPCKCPECSKRYMSPTRCVRHIKTCKPSTVQTYLQRSADATTSDVCNLRRLDGGDPTEQEKHCNSYKKKLLEKYTEQADSESEVKEKSAATTKNPKSESVPEMKKSGFQIPEAVGMVVKKANNLFDKLEEKSGNTGSIADKLGDPLGENGANQGNVNMISHEDGDQHVAEVAVCTSEDEHALGKVGGSNLPAVAGTTKDVDKVAKELDNAMKEMAIPMNMSIAQVEQNEARLEGQEGGVGAGPKTKLMRESDGTGATNDDGSKTQDDICCGLCNAKFINNLRLAFHKVVVHNMPDWANQFYKCEQCTQQCFDKNALDIHLSQFHPKN